MAIAQCPSCNKSISSKHKSCPHCETNLADFSQEDRERAASRNRVKRQQTVMNYSFIALILVLGGFLYIYWQQPAPNSFEMIASKSAIGIGTVWYLINRVILVILKKKK
ncbi:hypothetical protein HUZ36_17915 [Pseudoalteromonas sp. McH1-7]|uniref:Zinc-ribbon domain-containing protein n=1 Tax=Pseudoalteromonas peptidolytica F12-50-A1 TaxID=1315280 RepID=A0A8I0MVH9_9GAMM|nr:MULTISPECIES: hypothetical protein [Pseudoalteromonas]MBE0346566.1 hypothetical protein [Pseudoalteromonas peptidolytica F12-50-A1]MDW7550694.1 hypothetical protein [Pseudoalteromonas peptidolytica]NLR15377.1 hypothetical protein [Pseudoalteromonas peptidolytica]NUZ12662.1 hypothetical protein [Pseudoalteromonas sp. McH1-7]RRS06560.1 hypothetical protein EAG18_21605 [Pseudoalteromonas sp. J010]